MYFFKTRKSQNKHTEDETKKNKKHITSLPLEHSICFLPPFDWYLPVDIFSSNHD